MSRSYGFTWSAEGVSVHRLLNGLGRRYCGGPPASRPGRQSGVGSQPRQAQGKAGGMDQRGPSHMLLVRFLLVINLFMCDASSRLLCYEFLAGLCCFTSSDHGFSTKEAVLRLCWRDGRHERLCPWICWDSGMTKDWF